MDEPRKRNLASADHHRRMLKIYHTLIGLTLEESGAVLRNVADMIDASHRVSDQTPEFLKFVNRFHEMFGDEIFGQSKPVKTGKH